MPFDHELKMARALKHLQDLGHEVSTWLNGDHHTVRYELDRDSNWSGPIPPGPAPGNTARYFLAGSVFIPGQGPGTPPPGVQFGEGVLTAYATAEQPPGDPIGLLIGDALRNMRSALDNLAFALSSSYTNPLSDEFANSSEFPIFGDEDRQGNSGVGEAKFTAVDRRGDPARGSGLAKIRGWPPDAKTIVEGLQPYKRGQDFRSDPLWVLHELDRLDKHRLLHTTVAASRGTLWDIGEFRNIRCIGPGFIESMDATVETDTPISRIVGIHPIDPDTEMHVEIKPALAVAFSPGTSVAASQPVIDSLAAVYNYVVATVMTPLARFL